MLISHIDLHYCSLLFQVQNSVKQVLHFRSLKSVAVEISSEVTFNLTYLLLRLLDIIRNKRSKSQLIACTKYSGVTRSRGSFKSKPIYISFMLIQILKGKFMRQPGMLTCAVTASYGWHIFWLSTKWESK